MADQEISKEAALSWTDERVELLRKLWMEGLSASRIASELAGGVTRNAVIGKVHRLGLSGRVKAAAPAAARRSSKQAGQTSRTPISSRGAAMPMHGNLALQARPAVEIERSPQSVVVPFAENVTIMDLRESMCRWPVGDPSSPDFRYCGGKAPIGEGPYCAYHSRMAYQPSQERRAKKSA